MELKFDDAYSYLIVYSKFFRMYYMCIYVAQFLLFSSIHLFPVVKRSVLVHGENFYYALILELEI